MALAVSPTLLTAAELAKRKAAQSSTGSAYTSSIAARRRLAAALNAATKTVGARRAQQVYGSRYLSASAAERAQRTRYDAAKKALSAFTPEYSQLNKLSMASPNLDGVLNQLLPFDPQGAADRLGAQQQLNQTLIANKQGRDELGQDYAQGMQSLNQEQPTRYRALLNNFAGRGLAHSSGYASAFGEEAADFTKRQTDLTTQKQRGDSQYGLADAGAQSDFLSNIAAVLSSTTGRLAQNAGTLGMANNTNLPLLLELARRRLAAQGS